MRFIAVLMDIVERTRWAASVLAYRENEREAAARQLIE